MSRLSFVKGTSLDTVQTTLKSKVSLTAVEFIDNDVTDDEFASSVIPNLSVDLASVVMTRCSSLSSRSVTLMTSRCPRLQQIKFTDCPLLDISSIFSIGRNCTQLKSLSFVYDSPTVWTQSRNEVLATLVKVCTSELNSISFVGFDSVSDLEVAYVSECYSASLRRINLSRCRQVTDKSLLSLSSRCKDLKEVAFSTTQIGDEGLMALANNCPRLQRLDFTRCKNISDLSVVTVAQRCPKLERILLAGCVRVTSESLTSLLCQCPALQSIDLSETSIDHVPPTLLALHRLKHFNASNCPRMTNPPGNVTERGLDAIKECYKDFNLTNRLRVNVVGETGSGKTSLVHVLTGGERSLVEPKRTDDVNASFWQSTIASPVLGEPRSPSVNNKQPREICLEFWDFTGRTLCQGINHLFYSKETVYLIVFNLLNTDNPYKLTSYINAIQHRVPGCTIFLVGTHVDKLSKPPIGQTSSSLTTSLATRQENGTTSLRRLSDESLQTQLSDIMYNIKDMEVKAVENIRAEISALKLMESDARILKQIERLTYISEHRPVLPRSTAEIHVVSSINSEGIDSLRTSLLNLIQTSPDSLSHVRTELRLSTVSVTQTVLNRRAAGDVVMPWNEFKELALQDELVPTEASLEEEINFLQLAGMIMDLSFLDVYRLMTPAADRRFICVDPLCLAQLACAVHVDDQKKSFRVDARRFWSVGHRRPSPQTLLKALENIPKRGLIKDWLFPILWQSRHMNETQVLNVIDVLNCMSVLLVDSTSRLRGDLQQQRRRQQQQQQQPEPRGQQQQQPQKPVQPFLSRFVRLTGETAYGVTLMNLCSQKRPSLNWSARPPKGDILLSWRYEFPNGVPQGFKLQLLCACDSAAQQHCSYKHQWTEGAIFKIKQAMICVEHERTRVDIMCCVNADEAGRESVAVEYMWAHLSVFLLAAERFLHGWPGLFYKINLVPFGLPLYDGEVIVNERSFSIYKCMQSAQRGVDMSFTDDRKLRRLITTLLLPFTMSEFGDVQEFIDYVYNKRETVFDIVDWESLDIINTEITNRTKYQVQQDITRSTRSLHAHVTRINQLKWDLGNGCETISDDEDDKNGVGANGETELMNDSVFELELDALLATERSNGGYGRLLLDNWTNNRSTENDQTSLRLVVNNNMVCSKSAVSQQLNNRLLKEVSTQTLDVPTLINYDSQSEKVFHNHSSDGSGTSNVNSVHSTKDLVVSSPKKKTVNSTELLGLPLSLNQLDYYSNFQSVESAFCTIL